jgi:hypothetical protein
MSEFFHQAKQNVLPEPRSFFTMHRRECQENLTTAQAKADDHQGKLYELQAAYIGDGACRTAILPRIHDLHLIFAIKDILSAFTDFNARDSRMNLSFAVPPVYCVQRPSILAVGS